MKTLILPALLIFLLSCSEEEVAPSVPDPFVGSWNLNNPDTGLKVSFDINDDLAFDKIHIEHPELPAGTVLTYHGDLMGRFAVNPGYGQIKVFGSNNDVWIILTMTHNRIHLATSDTLDVYKLKIEMINKEAVVLDNQIFVRSM